MSSHIPTMKRYLFAVIDNRILRALSRCVFKFKPRHGVISLVLICVLYIIAEYTYSDWYFALGNIWKPAFPLSLRIILFFLFAVPTFSLLHLLWLSWKCLTPAWHSWRYRCNFRSKPSQWYSMVQRSDSNLLEESGLSGTGEDEDGDLQDVEDNAGLSTSRSPFQHHAPRSPFSFLRLCRFIFWFAISCTGLWFGLHYRHPGDLRYLPLIEKASAYPKKTGYGDQEKIFIAAMFYNNEKVLPYWSDSIIKVIHYLGTDNVFVSIVESNSDDQSPALLRQLDARLDAMDVQRRILIQDSAITKPHVVAGNSRTAFLSALRNRVLDPLVESGGYDKVIFSNDIFVEPESILELLYTAEGEYDMVCAMDYGECGVYDTWVVRDRRGRLASGIWPYFFDAEDHEAMRTESPVPVLTCWNGIVVFKADPILPIHLRSNRTLSDRPLPFALPSTHPAAKDPSLHGPSPALTPPLRFRPSAQGECFSSECFLFPYDLRRLFNMQRIFINPRVVVAYRWWFYVYFKWLMRHPVLKWWIENVYDGAWMHNIVLTATGPERVTWWDGGDCWGFFW